MKTINLSILKEDPGVIADSAKENEPLVVTHEGNAISVVLPLTPTLLHNGSQLSLAISFYERGCLTLYAAASIAKLHVEEFMERLSSLGVTVLDQSKDEFLADLKTLSDE